MVLLAPTTLTGEGNGVAAPVSFDAGDWKVTVSIENNANKQGSTMPIAKIVPVHGGLTVPVVNAIENCCSWSATFTTTKTTAAVLEVSDADLQTQLG